MTLEQLRVFVVVAEMQHMTKAASRLNLTQSAVSSAIAALESRYGVALFDRVGRGVTLTELGKAFVPQAQRVLDSAEGAEYHLRNVLALRTGVLNISASQTIASYWLPHYLQIFANLYAGVEVRVTIGNTSQVAQRLKGGQADLGFAEGAIDDPLLEIGFVEVDELLLVQKEKQTQPIDAAWLRAAHWVLREEGSGTRSSLMSGIASLGIDPALLKVKLVLPSNEAVRTAVETGGSVSALSSLVVRGALTAGRLHQLDLKLPSRPFFFVRHRQRNKTRASEALLELMTNSQP